MHLTLLVKIQLYLYYFVIQLKNRISRLMSCDTALLPTRVFGPSTISTTVPLGNRNSISSEFAEKSEIYMPLEFFLIFNCRMAAIFLPAGLFCLFSDEFNAVFKLNVVFLYDLNTNDRPTTKSSML